MTDHKVTWLDRCAFHALGSIRCFPSTGAAVLAYEVAELMLAEKLRIEKKEGLKTEIAVDATIDEEETLPVPHAANQSTTHDCMTCVREDEEIGSFPCCDCNMCSTGKCYWEPK